MLSDVVKTNSVKYSKKLNYWAGVSAREVFSRI
jgi:hypothetical protein